MLRCAAGKRQKLVRTLFSYWLSASGWQAWSLTFLLAVCTALIVLLNMQLNNWQVGFYNHLHQHSMSGFNDSLLQFVTIALVLAAASGCQTQFKMLLQIRWRQLITDKYITLWLYNQTYFRMSLNPDTIDNPDQRISEDIHLFVTYSVDLATGLLRQLIALIVFSAVLWQLSVEIKLSFSTYEIMLQGYLVWCALLYSAVGTWISLRVGRPLLLQNNVQQSNEADFRYCLIRLKEYGESVALYKGDRQEKINLSKHFAKIVATYLSIIKTTRALSWISSIYSQLSIVFAFAISSPRYFNNDLQLGQLFEISGAYWYVHSALSYIVDSYGKIAQWKAVIDRLQQFHAQIMSTQQLYVTPLKAATTFSKRKEIVLKDLSIFSPSGQVLLHRLSLALRQGFSLLITGPSGCGKTTLLKTLSGIWPFYSGGITLPSGQKLLFLPQQPYLPTGSLRGAIFYPHIAGESTNINVKELLAECGLNSLLEQLDVVADWSKLLSIGELQRLSLVRAIVQQPDWLFLDEITSSIDVKMEHAMYQILKVRLPHTSLVSIGHRDTLKAYHRLILAMDGLGSWRCFESAEQKNDCQLSGQPLRLKSERGNRP